ncbi:His-Xaa-Ser repeat protein HxsA2 [Bradyrhizobium oligotrophicum]|uniref:His-Xaa-Ser repeat protein HxsA2 n=1 Tax=Bradyrhizobium oligotrophicum TaxID=44255 RepID=UPI003EBF4E27
MTEKSKFALSLGAALASLTGMSVQQAESKAVVAENQVSTANDSIGDKPKANAFYQAGEDLLGFVMTKQADGTIVAGHSSHASHASHASHVSGR